jgi:hypothetical protein
MTAVLTLLFLMAAPPASTLDQVKAEPNPEHRARVAVDYAAVAEKNAEAAYAKGDLEALSAALKMVEESMTMAQESFTTSGKTPWRNPGPYKYAELHSRDLLIRLSDLELKMDASERDLITGVKTRVQEIHDAWFEGIMGKKR